MVPVGPSVLGLNYTVGAMGMSLFFALSGFLITSTLIHNPDVLEFLVKRLARIIPLAYAYTFIVFTVIVFDPKIALWTATFLINYFTEYMIVDLNNHLWSLCVEVHFYIAIALIVLTFGKRGLWIVWPACILITALRVHDGAYIAIQTHLRVDEILVGACVATVYRSSWKGSTRHPTATGCRGGFTLVHSGELFRRVASIFEALRDRAGARGAAVPWRYVFGARSGLPAYAICRGDLVRALCGPSGDNLRMVQSGNKLGTLSLQTADQFPADLCGRPHIDISLGKVLDARRAGTGFKQDELASPSRLPRSPARPRGTGICRAKWALFEGAASG